MSVAVVASLHGLERVWQARRHSMTGSDWTGLGLATSMAVAAALSAVLSTQFGLHIWRMQTQVGVVVVVVGTVIVGRKKPHIHE